jgi:hypothetical protein
MKRFKGFGSKLILALAAVSLIGAATIPVADAGITVFKDGDKKVKIGGRVQFQFNDSDPNTSDSSDSFIFRRLRPYIEGTVHQDWMGKIQWDMGSASGDNEIAVKDAYMKYTGFESVTIRIGNAVSPFSREMLTSSKYQQLIERTFVGDHNYGTPEWNMGLHLNGAFNDKKVTWGAAFTSSSLDPDEDKLDFDSPVNKNTDFNEGLLVAARVDFHPLGYLKFKQGDFKRDLKVTIGLAAFHWKNDDDNNDNTTAGVDVGAGKPDVDKVNGFEISAAIRGHGASLDVQYNKFKSETVDDTFTGGLYENGDTDLEQFAVEGGYMVIPGKLEIVAGYQVQDADNYATEWKRTSIGANYFVKKHDVKLQATFRKGTDLNGVKNTDEDEFFVQAQYVF